MPIHAVMFDLDGTLLGTLDDLANAVNHALRTLGRPTVDRQTVQLAIGRGSGRLVADALGQAHQHLLDDAHRRFLDHYRQHLFDKTQPYPGTVELIDELRQRGMVLAVLSNKPDTMTRRMVEHYFPGRFGRVAGDRDGQPRKPDPAAALQIAESLKFPPVEWAYVGDSGIDMQTAKAAGFLALGVTWGFRDEQELRTKGADAIAHDADQLLSQITRA